MRALVTGAAGFVGQWLCRAMLEREWEVAGTVLPDGVPEGALDDAQRARIRWIEADLRTMTGVRQALEGPPPDAIVHLAGIAYVPAAAADPGTALDVNVTASARMMAEVKSRRAAGAMDPVLLVIGSGEQYGRHEPAEMPLAETAEQRPRSVYAASKAAQEIVALEAFRGAGLRVIATRSFNHSGPGQARRFLLPALAERALALRAEGGSGTRMLRLGNVTPVRDFLHVADVVRAYLLLLERGTAGEVYNVASGAGHTVEWMAERILALAGVDARLQPDPALVRPADVPVLVGDSTKLRAATGWAPEHSLDSLLDELIRAAAY